MKKMILVIVIILILIVICFMLFKKEPNKLMFKYVFGNQGAGLGEFDKPIGLVIKDNYLFVADSGNSRIQVLKINPDGNLLPKFAFGREGKALGEFGNFPVPFNSSAPLSLAVKDNYLFVADSGNSRIQVLKINPDGNLLPKFAFGREGKALGEFMYPLGLVIKDSYIFVADSVNNRIQILKINFNSSPSPRFSFGKQGKGLGEFGGDNAYLTMLAIKDKFLYVADTGNNRLQVLEIKY